jgi:hypothetical protein
MTKNENSGFKDNVFKFLIVILAVIPMFLLTNCNKGKVEIYGVADTVRNCSLPYVAEFFPDAEFGSGDVLFEWDFGDGTSSNEESPTHVYNTAGLYQVTLTITNKEAVESKSISLDLRTNTLPVIAEWDYTTYTDKLWVPSEIFFQNYSEHATSYYWSFGDGSYSTARNPSHIFGNTGTFNIELSAICEGDTVKFAKLLTILPPPADLYIEDVLVWLPAEYLHTNVYCEVYFNSYSEAESATAVNISSFPAVLPIRKELFYFHGDFNDDVITFEIWEQSDSYNPAYVFSIPLYRIQDDFYPDVLTWEGDGGYAAEVHVQYQ